LPNQRSQDSNRVLIADDDPVILDIVQMLVEGEGFEVVTAQDGREAYRILHKDSDFRAVIFDMMMPHLEGSDLLRQMQTEKRLSRIPVIIMSASEDVKVMANSFEAGAVAFIPKPFTPDQMRNTLRMTLEGGRVQTVLTSRIASPPILVPRPTDTAETTIKVLLIEDNPGEAIVIEAVLLKAVAKIPQLSTVQVSRVDLLSDGIKQLLIGGVDVVLLDLSLPDSEGLETLSTLLRQGTGIPVVVLTGTDDGAISSKALQLGAQDYLIKGQVDEVGMTRLVRHAFEAKQARPASTVN
jgi:DNA-binding response OmpR family regulator